MSVKGKNGMVQGGSWIGEYKAKHQANWYFLGKVYNEADEDFYIQLSEIGKRLYKAAYLAHCCESVETPAELDTLIESVIELKAIALEYYNFVEKHSAKMYWVTPALINASYDVIQLIGSIQVNLLPYRYAVVHEIENRLRFFKYFIIEGEFIVGNDPMGVPVDLCELRYTPILGIGDFQF